MHSRLAPDAWQEDTFGQKVAILRNTTNLGGLLDLLKFDVRAWTT